MGKFKLNKFKIPAIVITIIIIIIVIIYITKSQKEEFRFNYTLNEYETSIERDIVDRDIDRHYSKKLEKLEAKKIDKTFKIMRLEKEIIEIEDMIKHIKDEINLQFRGRYNY